MKYTSIIFLLLIILIHETSAQQDISEILKQRQTTENVYLHLNKNNYNAGDTIWFKGYITAQHRPSILSSNFYVQLTSSSGELLNQKIYPIVGTTAIGYIHLPEKKKTESYLLTAFTDQQAREGKGIYRKPILLNRSKSSHDEQNLPNVLFFPENGKLIDGLKSKVVCFISINGEPLKTSAAIRLNEGEIISHFETDDDGYGSFEIKPYSNRVFTLEIEHLGKNYRTTIPESEAKGVQLKVENEKMSNKIFINRSFKEREAFKKVRLLGVMHNKMVIDQWYDFKGADEIITSIDKTNLAGGLLHFFILDGNNEILSERICFIEQKYTNAALDISFEKDLDNNQQHLINIKLLDSLPKTLSIAVHTDVQNSDSGILSNLLMNSELINPIDINKYYAGGKLMIKKLDQMLIANKSSILQNVPVITSKEPFRNHRNLAFSGLIVDEKTKQPMPGGLINFKVVTQHGFLELSVPVDMDGKFFQDSLIFFGPATAYYKYKTASGKNKDAEVILDSNSNLMLSQIQTNIDAKDTIKYQMLEMVTVRGNKGFSATDRLNEEYSSLRFKTTGRVILDNVNFEVKSAALSLTTYILTKVPQLRLGKDDHNSNVTFVNSHYFDINSGRMWPLELFIDEVPVKYPQLEQLRIEDVAMIKFHDIGFAAGALTVYMKKISPVRKETTGKSIKVYGYPIDEEYNPEVEIDKNKSNHQTYSLYWNPFLNVGVVDQITLKVPTTILVKPARIQIEGIDLHGRMISFSKVIE